ncbi:MAG: NAD+ synthase [candidate division NC10 bacterium]|jgi:NAD+ synthase|nr:NAD+ synthase [candidate division NC10 bacterium]MCH7896052.1 NAD+ synthase [candidate division NC10 bacterium]MCZ6550242.1 NAD+ synthase [candidate division NC10 bacterium]
MNPTVITPELTLDWDLCTKILSGFIQSEVRRAGFHRVIVGLSGGVDSSLAASLAAAAMGPGNVWGVGMPYKASSPESLTHARLIAEKLGINFFQVDITPQIDAYFAAFPDADHIRRGNKMARERMTVLYDHSARLEALVLGTSNKTELLLGYGTLYGDMASALNPIGDLYKTQVRCLASHLAVPPEIVGKQPSADLWVGQTDEEELGFTYEAVDRLLYYLVDRRYKPPALIELGFEAQFVEAVSRKIQSSQYKRRPPVIAKISGRTIDRDFRYPRDWGL